MYEQAVIMKPAQASLASGSTACGQGIRPLY